MRTAGWISTLIITVAIASITGYMIGSKLVADQELNVPIIDQKERVREQERAPKAPNIDRSPKINIQEKGCLYIGDQDGKTLLYACYS